MTTIHWTIEDANRELRRLTRAETRDYIEELSHQLGVPVAHVPVKHPEAPKLTPCAECRAPLRPEQIRRVDPVRCHYCELRLNGELRHSWERITADKLLDSRITAAQASPVVALAHDWDADDVEYEL